MTILPLSYPRWREDPEGVVMVQGLASLLESRLRALPRTQVFVRHLLLAPEDESQAPRFLLRSDMWPLHEALELPSPEEIEQTHVVQGKLEPGPIVKFTVQVIDVSAAFVVFEESIEEPPSSFPEKLYAFFYDIASAIAGEIPPRERLLITRQSTHDHDALRHYLVGIGRRIQKQTGHGVFTPHQLFNPFLEALKADGNFMDACIAADLLAQEAMQQRQLAQDAAESLKKCVKLAPHFHGFRRTLGVYLFDAGSLEEARVYLEEYIENTDERVPASAAAYVRLAAIYHQMNRLGKAQELLRGALKRFPNNPDIRESLGVCLAESGRMSEAEECWRKVLDEHPRRTTSLSNLAMVCWKNGDPERADVLFGRSIEAHDATEFTYSRYLEFLLEKEKLEPADRVATERVEKFPDNWQHWVQLAHIRRRIGQTSAAEYCLDQAEERINTEQAKDEIAIARFALRYPGEFPLYIAAVHTTTWTREDAPTTEEEKQECLSSAVNLLRGVTDRHPDFAFLWRVLADRLAQLGQFESAIAAQERYLRIVPTSASGHNLMAGLMLKAGRRTDAVTAFRRAVERAADPTVYRTNLATILIEEGDLDAAEEQLEAAENEKPADFVVAVLRDKLSEKRSGKGKMGDKEGFLTRLGRIFRGSK